MESPTVLSVAQVPLVPDLCATRSLVSEGDNQADNNVNKPSASLNALAVSLTPNGSRDFTSHDSGMGVDSEITPLPSNLGAAQIPSTSTSVLDQTLESM